MVEVAEENGLDSWTSTMSGGVDDRVDMIGAYGMMNGICEEEKDDKTLNI